MPKVRRPNDVGQAVNTLKRRHKRRCASAPATPTGLTVTYVKRHVRRHIEWYARVKWNRTTTDVNGRPQNVEAYDVQLRAVDASGNPVENDGADNDFWRKMTPDDSTPRVVFHPLPRPRTLYFQARIRVLNRIHGGRCWSLWSEWTAATQPVSGALTGPPAPTGLLLTFDRVEGAKGNPWRAKGRVNMSPEWSVPDGDPVDVDDYVFQLQVRSKLGVILNTRRGVIVDHDSAETYARRDFGNIRGKRDYRLRAKARALGRPGAWTSWTDWASPGGAPAPPTSVVTTNPTPRKIVVSWTPPTDLTDVDRYRVQIVRTSGVDTVIHTAYVAEGTHQYHWNIPKSEFDAHPNGTYRGRVTSVEAPMSEAVDDDPPSEGTFDAEESSTESESTDQSNTTLWTNLDIDVSTLPSEPSDGDAPTNAPAVSAVGTPRGVLLRWDGIVNGDPVFYDVYASLTSAFTPGASTLVASDLTATAFAVYALTDGTPLSPTTQYYFKVVPKDADGVGPASNEALGSPVELTSDDIAADAVVARHILGEQIDAEHIAAVVTLTSVLRTAVSGARTELSGEGFTAYGSDGLVIASIPTVGDPLFRAVIYALGLDVLGNATFRGAENVLSAGAAFVLQNKIANPTAAPTLVQDVPSTTLGVDAGNSFFSAYPWFDGTNIWMIRSQDSSAPVAYKFNASWGTLASATLAMPSSTTWHDMFLVKVGSYWFCLCTRGSDGDRRWIVWDATGSGGLPGALLDHGGYHQDEADNGNVGAPSLTTDGTKLYVLQSTQPDHSSMEIKVYSNPGTGAPPTYDGAGSDVTISTNPGTSAPCPFIRSNADFGATRYIIRTNTAILPFTTAGAFQANDDFVAAEVGASRGFYYNGGFKELKVSQTALWDYTGWVWTTESALYWSRYAWYDGTNRSVRSPVNSITLQMRRRLTITTPDLPTSQVSVYLDRGAAEPTLDHQADSASKQVQLSTFTAGGAAPPTTSTMPATTPAVVRSSDSSVSLDADGQLVVPGVTRIGKRLQLMSDFTEAASGLAAVGVTAGATGDASISSVAAADGHLGIWSLATGSAATNRASVNTGSDAVRMGDGIIRCSSLIKTGSNLSTATQRYQLYAGLTDTTTGLSTFNDIVMFIYRDDTNGGAWQARKRIAGVETTDPTDDNGGAVTVAINTWYLLEIVIDAAGSTAEFYINGVLKATISTLPTANMLYRALTIEKAVGTTSRAVWLDAYHLEAELLTARY